MFLFVVECKLRDSSPKKGVGTNIIWYQSQKVILPWKSMILEFTKHEKVVQIGRVSNVFLELQEH